MLPQNIPSKLLPALIDCNHMRIYAYISVGDIHVNLHKQLTCTSHTYKYMGKTQHAL